jgi:hypothetical protein
MNLKARSRALSGACLLLAGVAIFAQEPAPTATGPAASFSTNLPLKEISPGRFQLGRVLLNKEARSVSFPAVVNLKESPVEYFLVADYGKIHESVLRSAVQPFHVNLALLLLGAKGAGTNALPEDPKLALPGDKVTIEVRWKTDKGEKTARAEDLVFNRRTQSPMARGSWVYTGSVIFEATFLAQQEGSIVSLMTDPVALVNNPQPGREDDENWRPNPKALPDVETPVDVTIQLNPIPAAEK